MIEQGDILTLDDNNEYTVVAVAEYEKKNYCYLIDLEDEENISFCEILDNNELEEVTDENLIENLSKQFNELI